MGLCKIVNETASYGSFECVEESDILIGTGLVAALIAISAKDKIELKKAIKIYEKYYNPPIKLSTVQPTKYELDRDKDITNIELEGFKKIYNAYYNRAKVWKDSKGKYICSSSRYTKIGGHDNGEHWEFRINPKYKEHELYLHAVMTYHEGKSSKAQTILIDSMKDYYPDEMKNTKVKLIGKSLESMFPEGYILEGVEVEVDDEVGDKGVATESNCSNDDEATTEANCSNNDDEVGDKGVATESIHVDLADTTFML